MLIIFSIFAKTFIMLKKNKDLITLPRYANDINKAIPSIYRYITAGASIPGIQEYYKIDDTVYILKKADNYKEETKKVSKQKFIMK